jgi:hypothetical protein
VDHHHRAAAHAGLAGHGDERRGGGGEALDGARHLARVRLQRVVHRDAAEREPPTLLIRT